MKRSPSRLPPPVRDSTIAALPSRNRDCRAAKSPDDTETPTPLSLPTIEQQLSDARAAGDLHTQAAAAHARPVLRRPGERQEALSYYRQALEGYEATDDNDGILAALDALAAITAQADDVEGALVYATRGVNLAQQIGDRDRLGRLQTRLADVPAGAGRYPGGYCYV